MTKLNVNIQHIKRWFLQCFLMIIRCYTIIQDFLLICEKDVLINYYENNLYRLDYINTETHIVSNLYNFYNLQNIIVYYFLLFYIIFINLGYVCFTGKVMIQDNKIGSDDNLDELINNDILRAIYGFLFTEKKGFFKFYYISNGKYYYTIINLRLLNDKLQDGTVVNFITKYCHNHHNMNFGRNNSIIDVQEILSIKLENIKKDLSIDLINKIEKYQKSLKMDNMTVEEFFKVYCITENRRDIDLWDDDSLSGIKIIITNSDLDDIEFGLKDKINIHNSNDNTK